ncbi:DUF460 domain-containing protein, partial [Candidatus Marsarchaeota archaeon]|nr:DUF460 domain-containing protein [Candidatus Marsarchaeota archaeon]
MAHIIVGVDTGKTVAIACLSLEGKMLLTAHMKNGGIQWLINEIRETGTPSVIASDKKDRGDTIRRVNSAFNAILFMPKSDISMAEKKSAARTATIKDQHERDAYVAAVKAYNYYANKLKLPVQ